MDAVRARSIDAAWMAIPEEERRARVLGLRYPPRIKMKIEDKGMQLVSTIERGRMTRYNLTLGQWGRLFQKQGECCAICGAKTPGSGEWHSDHDHVTGKLRGILCRACNNGLGNFRDSLGALQAAFDYLTNPPFTEDI